MELSVLIDIFPHFFASLQLFLKVAAGVQAVSNECFCVLAVQTNTEVIQLHPDVPATPTTALSNNMFLGIRKNFIIRPKVSFIRQFSLLTLTISEG